MRRRDKNEKSYKKENKRSNEGGKKEVKIDGNCDDNDDGTYVFD